MFFGDIFRLASHIGEIRALWNDVAPIVPAVTALEADYERLVPRTIALFKQIEPIMVRVRALEAEIFGPPAATPGPSPEVEMVKWVQLALNNLGERLTIDGDPGRATEAAVKYYQSANGLDVDGIIGPQTIASLWRRYGAG